MMERTNEGTEARRFRIAGRVQGVGFRWWTRETASGLGLVGRVWNRQDGGVEVVARGPRDALARLEEALARGPAAARVDTLEVLELGDEPGEPRDVWTGFEIRRV